MSLANENNMTHKPAGVMSCVHCVEQREREGRGGMSLLLITPWSLNLYIIICCALDVATGRVELL